MTALLLVVVALPAAAALLAAALPRRSAQLAARLGSLATGAAFGLAIVLAAHVATAGPVDAVLEDRSGQAIVGLYADEVAALLLLLVTGVSAVVQVFASRYLQGDEQAGRFSLATGVLTTSTAALVSAATLIGLALAWTAAGVALCVLLALYASLPAAREGVRRTARTFVIADGALWLAVAVATISWGGIDLRTLGADASGFAADSLATGLFACLVVVAAIGRSAQLPLQRWLPATLAAPTPVSALLHAGVVNGGGVLLVKLSPLFAASALATHLAFAVGAATVVYGTTLMLVKTDVKGALALSTVGQMGFMVMTCGLGAFAAAVFHLVAHGMYKASLFLGSGSAVRRHVRHLQAPPRPQPRGVVLGWIVACSAVIPAAALWLAHALLHPSGAAASQDVVALLVFAWVTAGWATGRRWIATANSARHPRRSSRPRLRCWRWTPRSPRTLTA